jgi:hypothetical protein
MANDDGFLSRWSRRKVQARTGEAPAEADPPIASTPAARVATVGTTTALPATETPKAKTHDTASIEPAAKDQPVAPPAPLPTMDDVMALTKESDYSPFVKQGVDPTVRNAAFKKLFSDPFFNEMDGLDIYIDDYSQPNPLPLSLARKLNSAKVLNLFETPEEKAARLAKEAAQSPVTASSHSSANLEQSAPGVDEPPNSQDAFTVDPLDPQGTRALDSNSSQDSSLTVGGNQQPYPSAQPKHTP